MPPGRWKTSSATIRLLENAPMIGRQAEIPAGSVDADAVGGGKGDTAQDSTLPRPEVGLNRAG